MLFSSWLSYYEPGTKQTVTTSSGVVFVDDLRFCHGNTLLLFNAGIVIDFVGSSETHRITLRHNSGKLILF
ncbi:hypothetical protein BSQ33_06265 [Vibrio gazogenes]|uniref:Uncharacterized protein n=1 Tax=Vibrio gazogenes TaxID=687 RepID=A0A1Z2SDW7_VIBGA|nr:hypothetical protein BSQ33_06265 [Vibrio gazogenes]